MDVDFKISLLTNKFATVEDKNVVLSELLTHAFKRIAELEYELGEAKRWICPDD